MRTRLRTSQEPGLLEHPADAFAYFKEAGIFNRDVADRFREFILSKGGTEDPMDLYKRFRGREPEINALLERAGLMKADA